VSDPVDRYEPLRELRRKRFEDRCLATALQVRREAMAVKVIAEAGTIEDMRAALIAVIVKLELLVDLIVSVSADVRPK